MWRQRDQREPSEVNRISKKFCPTDRIALDSGTSPPVFCRYLENTSYKKLWYRDFWFWSSRFLPRSKGKWRTGKSDQREVRWIEIEKDQSPPSILSRYSQMGECCQTVGIEPSKTKATTSTEIVKKATSICSTGVIHWLLVSFGIVALLQRRYVERCFHFWPSAFDLRLKQTDEEEWCGGRAIERPSFLQRSMKYLSCCALDTPRLR